MVERSTSYEHDVYLVLIDGESRDVYTHDGIWVGSTRGGKARSVAHPSEAAYQRVEAIAASVEES